MNGVIGVFSLTENLLFISEYLRCDLRKNHQSIVFPGVSVIGFNCFKSEYIPWLTHHLL